MDESGKGDFFGPVVSACVVAESSMIRGWMQAGVRDSKTIGEAQIDALDELIRRTDGVVVKTAWCSMARYNELMARPRANLNKLLGWLHAKSLDGALAERRVPWGLLDQFTKDRVVEEYLQAEGFELRMRTKAEEDPVVAAASIVARAEFVRQMRKLSELAGEPLLKGAGPQVKEQARRIVRKFGARRLPEFAKLHFRTAYEVVSELGLLGELPLKPPGPKLEWKGGKVSVRRPTGE
jgi:ribonuclease HIII